MRKTIFLILFIFLAATSGRAQINTQPLSNWGTGGYNDIVVTGNFAYCAAGTAGLDIFDVSNLAKPLLTENFQLQHSCESLFITDKYIYITGNNFADRHSSFTIIDISDRNHPETIGSIDDLSKIKEVAVAGNYAYIASYTNIIVIDISNPTQPQQVGSNRLGIAPMWLTVRDNYVYMANIFRGLQVIDISDPADPVLVTTNDAMKRLNDITLQGDFAYVSSESDGLGVFDISNPETPKLVGEYRIDTGSTAISKSADGNEIILTDRENTLYTFAISDPTRPELSATLEMAGTGSGVAARNDLIFITEGIKGLEIINISKPEEPKTITHYDLSGTLESIVFSEENAYLGDYDGIQIIDISNPTTPKQAGRIPTEGRVANLFLTKDYLYSVGDTFFGLKITDISDPVNPETVASIDPKDGEYLSFTAVAVTDNYAYITSRLLNQIFIYDVSAPEAPFLASQCDCPDACYDLVIDDNYAIIANGRGGLTIIDITNPLQPTLISGGNRELYGYRVAATGNFVYLSDSDNRILTFDISNPAQPEKTAAYNCECERIYDLFINDDYLFAATDTGLKSFSISDRRDPQKLTDIAESYKVNGVFNQENLLGLITERSGKFMLLEIQDDAAIDKIPPAPITELSASGQGFASLRLNWQAATDNDGGSGIGSYRVYRHDYSLEHTYATVNSSLTEFVDPNCEPDSAYTYTVKAVDKSDNSSPASHTVTVKTRSLSSDHTPPTAPTDLHVNITPGKLTLDWNLSFDNDSGVATYELYKVRVSDTQPDGTGPTTKLTTPFTSFTDTKVSTAARYRYQVRAIDYAGNTSELTTIIVSIPEQPAAEQHSYFFPHFCSDENWETIFSITNHNAVAANAYLQLFASDGTKLLEKQLYYGRPDFGFIPGAQIYSNDHHIIGEVPSETAWMRVDSDIELSFMATLTSDTYQESLYALPTLAPTLLFPVNMQQSADRWTGLALANPATTAAQIILKAYNNSGELLAFSPPFFLPANGHTSALASDFFNNGGLPETTVSIRAEATTAIAGMEFFSRPNSEMAGLPAIPLKSSTECSPGIYLYTLPNDPANNNNSDSITLVNLSSETATITILRQDQADLTRESETLSIPGNGKLNFNPTGYSLGATKVISDKSLVLFQEYKAANSGRGFATACAFSHGLAEINFTHLHLERHENGKNLITVTNLSRLKPNPIILEFFQGDGELLQTRKNVIQAGTTFSRTIRDLLGVDYYQVNGRDCWLRIKGDFPINGFLSYQSADNNRLTLIPAE